MLDQTIRRLAVALGLAALALSATASAASAPAIIEYTAGMRPDAAPTGIVTGPDGNLWIIQSGGTKAVDTIAPSGVMTASRPVSTANPRDLAVGPEGNLWFTSGGPNGVAVVDPQSGTIHEYPLPSGSSNPAGIVAGPEGDIWFAVEGGEAMIDRLVPGSGEIDQFKVPTSNSHPDQITFGREGDLWFTENNTGAIGRLNPTSKAFVEYSAGVTANSKPEGITTGPDGNIWFTEAVNPGRIGRINPATGAITEFSTGLTVGSPQQIVTGSDGNLYFTESNANGAIGQITPAGQITEYTEGLTPNAKPWGIATGPEGNIWFTQRGAPALIGKLAIAPLAAPAASAGVPGPTAAPSTAPVPVLGRSAGVYPLAGTIRVKTSARGGFVPLSGAATIPVGSVIDTTRGLLRMVTALNRSGATQAVTVWAGEFRVSQKATGNGMTHLTLAGQRPVCGRRAGAHASSTRTRPAKTRKLWAQDEHGRYQSYGSYSATTVMGTRWETLDTCSGTLTRVAKGKVRVRDLGRRRTVVVSAGHSYLARA
jgi:streptogramin lyase